MGYYARSLPSKKSAPQWKIQFVSFKKVDTVNSRSKKPKREWDIPRSRWQALGFNTFMSRDEAMARARQLNAALHLKRQEEQLKKIADAQAETL